MASFPSATLAAQQDWERIVRTLGTEYDERIGWGLLLRPKQNPNSMIGMHEKHSVMGRLLTL